MSQDEIGKVRNYYNEIDKKISILQTEFKAHAEYTKLALDKSELMLNSRLDSMNEFREQLKDQSKTFITVDIYSAQHKVIENKIEAVQKFMWLIIGGLLVIQVFIGILDKFMVK